MSVTFRAVQPPNRGERVSQKGEWANFANEHVRPLLAACGLDAGEYLTGEIAPDEVAAVLAECEIAMTNCADALVRRAPMLRDREHRNRWISQASNDASACDRLARLESVLVYAQARGLGVSWS